MTIRNVKIQVETPEKSRAVQEYLFANGCCWAYATKEVQFTHGKYLYVDRNGILTYGTNSGFFHDNEMHNGQRELKFDFETTIIATPQRRQTVCIFGKLYDKEEFDLAVSKLKTVEV